MDKELLLLLKDEGFTSICIRNNKLCGILRFLDTIGVCIDIDEIGWETRYYFDTMKNAELFLSEWTGDYKPVVGEDGCTSIAVWKMDAQP